MSEKKRPRRWEWQREVLASDLSDGAKVVLSAINQFVNENSGKAWDSRIISESDNLAFVAVPGGGGDGGGGGKQIVGLIAALALSIAAPMIGGWAATAFFGGSAIAANLVSGLLPKGGPILLGVLD